MTPQIDQIQLEGVPHLVTYRNHGRPRRADQHPLAAVTAGGNHHAIATVTPDGVFHRMLTRRERARAQGFPDDYEFHGGTVLVGKRRVDEVVVQIGNAVSVNVARWLGERVAEHLGAPTAATAA
ncbi:DNA cytosine methyltransferase [Nocardia sp. NPDC051570]|uniref:DNA cytosine methyltransferase n=1 Tax=Nocardia sp. NPDC051570 TaxID=3364324 RepID=UPI003799E9E3